MKSPFSIQVVVSPLKGNKDNHATSTPEINNMTIARQSNLPDFWAVFRQVAQDLTPAPAMPSIVHDIQSGKVSLQSLNATDERQPETVKDMNNKFPDVDLG